MSFPNGYTTFSSVPAEFPLTYSELTDDVFIWNSPTRTLSEAISLSQAQIDAISAAIATTINTSIINKIDLHDTAVQEQLTNLESTLRQIIAAVVTEVNENQFLIETIKGDKIKVII